MTVVTVSSSNAKRLKSRSGCLTCKQRRIKCDETRPQCVQCQRRHIVCPGYPPRYRWSLKHQYHEQKPSSAPPKASSSDKARTVPQLFSAISAPRLALTFPQDESESVDDIQESLGSNAELRALADSNCDQVDQPSEPANPEGQQIYTQADESWLLSNDTVLDDEELELSLSFPLLRVNAPLSKRAQWVPTEGREMFGNALSLPPRSISCERLFMTKYFSDIVCKFLSAYDSSDNIFRLATVPRMANSPLHYSLSKYLTAAYLSGSNTCGDSGLLRQAQTDVLSCLQHEVASLTIQRSPQTTDILLATIMYGMSTSWDGLDSTSLIHYNAAVTMFKGLHDRITRHQHFFRQALIYWWMGLSFVTDGSIETILDPPQLESDIRRFGMRKLSPHPLTGVAPQACLLLGKVGSLVRGQRQRGRQCRFTSIGDIMHDFNTLSQARSLEEELLSLRLAESQEIIDTNDPNTPIHDLIRIGHAYRMASLLLLYRAFPDLPMERLSMRNDLTNDTRKRAIDGFLNSLALHILFLLDSNAPTSGTRSIEPILLVIVAQELRTSATEGRHGRETIQQDFASIDTAFGSIPELPPLTEMHHRLATCGRDQPTAQLSVDFRDSFGHDSIEYLLHREYPEREDIHVRTPSILNESETETGFYHEVDELSVSLAEILQKTEQLMNRKSQCDPRPKESKDVLQEARKVLSDRLKVIREILPYKSTEYLEQLVHETWARQDRINNTNGAFWLDIMIDKGWSFLLA